MVDAVKKHSSAEVVMSLGVPTVLSDDTSGIAAAVEMAKGADEVILAVGTDLSWAHEEHDADNITFTAAQAQLISQVAEAAKKPVVVVTYTATPLDLTEVMANEKVGAILHVGQPSVTVVGVGELLFGKTSPAGRTVQTIYPVCRNGWQRCFCMCVAGLSGVSFCGAGRVRRHGLHLRLQHAPCTHALPCAPLHVRSAADGSSRRVDGCS